MPTKPVFGGYAFNFIHSPKDVTGFEVRGVAVDNDTGFLSPDGDRVFFSHTPEWFRVYARMRTGEAKRVGDFQTREEADEYAAKLQKTFTEWGTWRCRI